jgi:hypothetical protein
MDRTKNISLIVLILLVVGAFGYIGYDKYSDMNQEKQILIFNQGAEYAIIQIAQNAATCQQVPLTIENQTINLIAVECLQQAAEQEA